MRKIGLWMLAALFLSGCTQNDFAYPVNLSSEGVETAVELNIRKSGNYIICLFFDRKSGAGSTRKYDELLLGKNSVETEVELTLSSDDFFYSSNNIQNDSNGSIGLALGGREMYGNFRVVKDVVLKPGKHSLRYMNKRKVPELEGINAYVVLFYYNPKI